MKLIKPFFLASILSASIIASASVVAESVCQPITIKNEGAFVVQYDVIGLTLPNGCKGAAGDVDAGQSKTIMGNPGDKAYVNIAGSGSSYNVDMSSPAHVTCKGFLGPLGHAHCDIN
ncbi:MAG: hypothetical protein K0U29_02585 [Gammaproteobacteria bacterium]|nr:hypothetical protein [Gammaproteobacteria bacterium]MCH9743796.1 hypothetical protein [Gammaproteobacteria bacterium]